MPPSRANTLSEIKAVALDVKLLHEELSEQKTEMAVAQEQIKNLTQTIRALVKQNEKLLTMLPELKTDVAIINQKLTAQEKEASEIRKELRSKSLKFGSASGGAAGGVITLFLQVLKSLFTSKF